MNRESMLLPTEAMGGAGAFNLGQIIGLHGLACLIPLIAMWGIVGGLVALILRKQAGSDPACGVGASYVR